MSCIFFDGRYKSSLVQGNKYLLIGKQVGMWTPHPLYLALGSTQDARLNSYLELISEALTVDAIAKIRHCANTELVLGTEKCRQQIEALRSS